MSPRLPGPATLITLMCAVHGACAAATVNLTVTVVDVTGDPLPCRMMVQVMVVPEATRVGALETSDASAADVDNGVASDASLVSLLPASVRARYDPVDKLMHEVKPQAANGTELWFATSGVARDIPVPVMSTSGGGGGNVSVMLRVERGHEYNRVKTAIVVSADGGAQTSHSVVLHRWVDMRSEGLVSIDNHVRAMDPHPTTHDHPMVAIRWPPGVRVLTLELDHAAHSAASSRMFECVLVSIHVWVPAGGTLGHPPLAVAGLAIVISTRILHGQYTSARPTIACALVDTINSRYSITQ
jgi:hypothetical protein